MDTLKSESPNTPAGLICKYCGLHLSSKGTYGRHLDSRKGDPKHPKEEIEKIRANVIRRGKSRLSESVEIAKNKKRLLAKTNYSKVSVQEKSKLRRKERDTRIKAKLKATEWFCDTLASNITPINPSTFGGFVAIYLPPKLWPPFGEVPGENEFKRLLAIFSLEENTLSNKLFEAFTNWKHLDDATKIESWRRDTYSAARMSEFSFHSLCIAPKLLEEKQNKLYEDYTQGDILELLASEEEKET